MLQLDEASIDCAVDPRYAEWSRAFAVLTVNNRLKRLESAAANTFRIVNLQKYYLD